MLRHLHLVTYRPAPKAPNGALGAIIKKGTQIMRSLILAAMIAILSLEVNAQTMRPHNGPICPGPGPVYVKPAPACGATTLHGGFFKKGLFRLMYQSTTAGCIPREVFLRCQ